MLRQIAQGSQLYNNHRVVIIEQPNYGIVML